MYILQIFFFHFWGVLNLDIFYIFMLRWFMVCVICNFKCLHSFIFKLCIMIDCSYIEHVPLLFVQIFRAVELDIFFSIRNA